MGFLSGLLDVAASIAVHMTEEGQRNMRNFERSHRREFSNLPEKKRTKVYGAIDEKMSGMDSLADSARSWSESRKNRRK